LFPVTRAELPVFWSHPPTPSDLPFWPTRPLSLNRPSSLQPPTPAFKNPFFVFIANEIFPSPQVFFSCTGRALFLLPLRFLTPPLWCRPRFFQPGRKADPISFFFFSLSPPPIVWAVQLGDCCYFPLSHPHYSGELIAVYRPLRPSAAFHSLTHLVPLPSFLFPVFSLPPALRAFWLTQPPPLPPPYTHSPLYLGVFFGCLFFPPLPTPFHCVLSLPSFLLYELPPPIPSTLTQFWGLVPSFTKSPCIVIIF